MPTQTFQEIPLSDIMVSGNNRRQIDEKSEEFQELKASIAAGGVRIPIQVRGPDKKGRYELRAARPMRRWPGDLASTHNPSGRLSGENCGRT